MIADTGNRTDFGSGALRDMAEGKGRTDLLPWSTLAKIFTDLYTITTIPNFCVEMDHAIRGNQTEKRLIGMLELFMEMTNIELETAILEVAIHYEEGAKKYSERNWEKGMPIHIYLDSCGRHFLKHIRGDKDERHDRAVIWNILCALWTLENKPEWSEGY